MSQIVIWERELYVVAPRNRSRTNQNVSTARSRFHHEHNQVFCAIKRGSSFGNAFNAAERTRVRAHKTLLPRASVAPRHVLHLVRLRRSAGSAGERTAHTWLGVAIRHRPGWSFVGGGAVGLIQNVFRRYHEVLNDRA